MSVVCKSKAKCGFDGCSAKQQTKLHGAGRVYPRSKEQEPQNPPDESPETIAAPEDCSQHLHFDYIEFGCSAGQCPGLITGRQNYDRHLRSSGQLQL